ncbi:MAG: FRG domain-containing protein, partial [Bacteroidales bacterium]
MTILYRCPNCNSVIKREQDLDEIYKMFPEKCSYQCGICGEFIPATKVLTGQYDIIQKEIEISDAIDGNIPFLKDILVKLKEEHTDEYVYRGQTKEWNGPLLPSIYRGLTNNIPLNNWDTKARLRELGNVFYEISSSPLGNISQQRILQRQIINYLTQMFGYPFAHLLAQQCGLTSEGLDITKDPEVAAFFATFDFDSNHYIESDDIGIIYRFRIQNKLHGVEDFKRFDFYSCPAYLNPNIFKLLKPCNSIEESLRSFKEYGGKYFMRFQNTSDPVRPLEVLKLPLDNIEKSRLFQQNAGLLMPDMILSKFYANIEKAAPEGKAIKEGENAIEDIATRKGTEKFLFRHSKDSKKYFTTYKERILPNNDMFKTIVMSFLEYSIVNF